MNAKKPFNLSDESPSSCTGLADDKVYHTIGRRIFASSLALPKAAMHTTVKQLKVERAVSCLPHIVFG